MSVFSRTAQVVAAVQLIAGAPSNAMAQREPPLPPLPPPPEAPVSSLPPLPAPTSDAPSNPPVREPEGADPSDVDGAMADDADLSAALPPHPDAWAARRLMVEGHVGIGTPVGFLGIALDYSPWPVLGMNLGIGLGAAGPQYAFTPRVRLLRMGRRTHVALYLGAGVSAGPYDSPPLDPLSSLPVDGSQHDSRSNSSHFHWNMAYWTNLEAGVEIRRESGLSLRPYAGVSRLLNPAPSASVADALTGQPPTGPVEWSGYVGFALGYAMAGW